MRVPAVPAIAGLAAFPVTVGGVTCTAAQAADAARVLSESKSSAIRALLRGAGSPLAECDYWAAAGPYLSAAKAQIAPTGQRGCAGRHVAKTAFCEAVCAAVEGARPRFQAAAVSAFARDSRYAAQMAADAVDIRRKAHAARCRDLLRKAVDDAVRSCRSRAGEFTCALEAACGTGACPFAAAPFTGFDVPAAPGRRPRPANHGGPSFSEAAALAAWLDAAPYRPRYTVTDADQAVAADEVAA